MTTVCIALPASATRLEVMLALAVLHPGDSITLSDPQTIWSGERRNHGFLVRDADSSRDIWADSIGEAIDLLVPVA